MNTPRSSLMTAIGLGAVLAAPVAATTLAPSELEAVVSPGRVSEAAEVRDLQLEGGAVSGVLVNKSTKVLRDVRLLVRHEWLWDNEFRPGHDEFGSADYTTVPGDIPPGGQKPFTIRAESLPSPGQGGHFKTSVEVVGLTEVPEVASARTVAPAP